MVGPPIVHGVTVDADDLNAYPWGYQDDGSNSTNVTLSSTAAFAASGSVTVVVPTGQTRRYKITGICNVRAVSGAPANYLLQAAYNTGATASIGSAVLLGVQSSVLVGTAGISQYGEVLGTVLLPAGTYTFYCSVTRSSGGSTTDTARSNYVLVEDCAAV